MKRCVPRHCHARARRVNGPRIGTCRGTRRDTPSERVRAFNEGTPSEECILSRSFLRCAILCYTSNDDNCPQVAAPSSRRFSRLLTAPIAN